MLVTVCIARLLGVHELGSLNSRIQPVLVYVN
jgi:hypothetical protein